MDREWLNHAIVLLVCLVGGASGCGERPEAVMPREAHPARNGTSQGVTLKLLVVDDPELAGGIRRLRGEWAERTGGGRLQVIEWASSDLVAAKSLPVDLVVYPSRYLGTLARKNYLRPLRASVLRSSRFAQADLLPAIRNREMVYGGCVYAVPFGSPPLMLCYNVRMLQAAGCEVPSTWADYRRVVGQLEGQAMPCPLPLADKAAASMLLARAVSYARQEGHMTLLFDIDTFEPRIASPPFVRALEEMTLEITRHQEMSQGEAELATSPFPSFSDAVKEVAIGRAAMTFGWPGVYCPQSRDAAHTPVGVSYAPLPRAKDCYRVTRNRWETSRVDTPVTLLGVAGRLASVTTFCRNAASAFKLLLWLGSGETATGISARSRSTLWYRHSQVEFFQRWQAGCQGLPRPGLPVAEGLPAITGTRHRGMARTVVGLLSSDECFLLPRIPGIDRYLESLADAVRGAIAGETAQSALQRAAGQWRQITRSLGRTGQQASYRAHLGL